MGEERPKEKVNVVFDANIWVSIILKKILASELEALIKEKTLIEAFLSREMLSELARLLTYPRITSILAKSNIDPMIALASTVELVTIEDVSERIKVITSDPADNSVLECAVTVGAKYIVTGDPHLLELGEFRGIKIIKARDFIKIMQT